MPVELLEADWSEPGRVRAVSTTRRRGDTQDELDLGRAGGKQRLERNRARLYAAIGKPRVQWLRQVHGTRVHHALRVGAEVQADAVWTEVPEVAIAVTTADCIPIVLADSASGLVAVIHCGWRGAVGGVIEATLRELPAEANDLRAWLGPAICGRCYEVGGDVYEKAMIWPEGDGAFSPAGVAGKWLFDLPAYAAGRLKAAGVYEVWRSNACTFHEDRFFSYRRDGRTGLMATVAWIDRR
ncbi:MAG: peptidoglycan editing factor PgeF [Gammaproteobacteria bacterium]|nr:peptidoglycan editing factor PgeF [Gammaproteobacteria bacterium]